MTKLYLALNKNFGVFKYTHITNILKQKMENKGANAFYLW